jgi:formate dehydrogenase iron-sulfur subunit
MANDRRDMVTLGRRCFLKGIGATTGGALLAARPARADTLGSAPGGVEFSGMLIDTTKCVGCRACEAACNEANQLPKPKVDFDSDTVFTEQRDTTPDAFTVINRFSTIKSADEGTYVRKQCMHCNQPGCASACLTRALEKTKEGPVIYTKDRCMGCRYCMVACPFDAPKYQYDKPAPFVRKCTFCAERQKRGEQPACAEACPTGATLFGKKRDLLDLARSRVAKEPDKYYPKIYGEHEVGGTGWLYLLPAAPERLGLPVNLGTTPYPELTSGFLYGVPLVFVLWPSLLVGLNSMVKGEEETASKEGGSHDHE